MALAEESLAGRPASRKKRASVCHGGTGRASEPQSRLRHLGGARAALAALVLVLAGSRRGSWRTIQFKLELLLPCDVLYCSVL